MVVDKFYAMKKFFFFVVLALIGAAAVNSCEKKTFEMWYEVGIVPMADAPLYKEEKELVEGTFRASFFENFGFRSDKFALMAKDISDTGCDEKVVQACEKAAAELDGQEFKSMISYEVCNSTTGKLVFRYRRNY